MELGKQPKNEIVEMLQASRFSLADFRTSEDEHMIELQHLPTDAKIKVSYGARHGVSSKFVGFWKIDEEPQRKLNADTPVTCVNEWLIDLEQYLDTPDLWADFIDASGAEAVLADDDPNTPFDATEQAEIAAWAADLEQNAPERYSLDDEQMKVLVGDLRELVQASGKLGRKDWYKMAVGSFVGIVMNRVVDAPVAQQVLEGMVSALGHLFGHPIPQLGPGPIF